jgi:two-component system sensor histidine kinase/response regulator
MSSLAPPPIPETAPVILVIDDQIDNFDVIELLLSREEYNLFYSSSGPRAFALMENIHPDLIILDVMMPEMDGIEVCRRLKKNPQSQHIPVLMVTALNTKEDLARCLEEGADDFLSKPIEGMELKARVHSLLRIKRQYDQLQNLIKLREEALQLWEELSKMIIHNLRNSLADKSLSFYIFLRYLDQSAKPICVNSA